MATARTLPIRKPDLFLLRRPRLDWFLPQALAVIVQDHPSKVWTWAKVYQEAKFQLCCLQIVEELGFMAALECASGLQFDNYTVADDEIDTKIPDRDLSLIHI